MSVLTLATMLIFSPMANDPELVLADLPLSEHIVTQASHGSDFSGYVSESLDAQATWIKAPPARFNHVYHGTIEVRFVHPWNIGRDCGLDGAGGCQITASSKPGYCVIELPAVDTVNSSFDAPMVAALFIHERAHCEGWGADHGE